jgi:hypothetical protein
MNDSVVGSLVNKRIRLTRELTTVARAIGLLEETESVKTLTAHFSVLSDDCYCEFCREWRDLRDELNILARRLTASKKQKYYDLLFAFVAITNKRDLWCEISYHVSHNTDLTNRALDIMKFIKEDMDRDPHTDSFWRAKAAKCPLAYWFDRISEALDIPLDLFISS